MFDKIDGVNWKTLKQAHGNASQVPEAIRGLISEDPELQQAAYWKLDNNIVLQSDLYESAYYVIPFLIEILSSDVIAGRKYVYDLLFEIANGFAPETSVCTHEGNVIPLTEACRATIGKEIDLYLSEIGNPLSTVRANALELVKSLGEVRYKTIPFLEGLLASEGRTEFGALISDGISDLNDL